MAPTPHRHALIVARSEKMPTLPKERTAPVMQLDTDELSWTRIPTGQSEESHGGDPRDEQSARRFRCW